MSKQQPPYSAIIKAYAPHGFMDFPLYIYCGRDAWIHGKAECRRGGQALVWPPHEHFALYDWSCVRGYKVIVDDTGNIAKVEVLKFAMELINQGAVGIVLNDKEGCTYYG